MWLGEGSNFSLPCPFPRLVDREHRFLSTVHKSKCDSGKAQEKPPRAPFGRHRRPCKPFPLALKANGRFPLARWNGSKVYFRAGNLANQRLVGDICRVDADRSTPGSEVLGAGHAGGLLEESSKCVGSGHQTAPKYSIKHSEIENGRQTAAI